MTTWEQIAKGIALMAVEALGNVNPIAATIAGWGVDVAFEILDDVEKRGFDSDPVAAAQHVSDRVVDLIEVLKLSGKQ
jgi:hypothetical protein